VSLSSGRDLSNSRHKQTRLPTAFVAVLSNEINRPLTKFGFKHDDPKAFGF
jgi:hypothetical protein